MPAPPYVTKIADIIMVIIAAGKRIKYFLAYCNMGVTWCNIKYDDDDTPVIQHAESGSVNI